MAVIGASRHRGTIGGEFLQQPVADGFNGAVYAVNDKAPVVQSLPAYRSVSDIPGGVDLAVVAVPAEEVVEAARDCAAAGVRGLLVISSGFAETGAEGAQRQSELLAVKSHAGIRIVGPNCLGALNTSPDVRLNATFAPFAAVPGEVGATCPRAGLGIAIIEAANRLGVGAVVGLVRGNKSDLAGNDFLQYVGAGPAHQEACSPLPGIVRQPPEVRSRRPPGDGHEADPGGQERPVGSGRPRDLIAHRCHAVGVGRDRGCAVRAGGRHPDGTIRRAARRRRAALRPNRSRVEIEW